MAVYKAYLTKTILSIPTHNFCTQFYHIYPEAVISCWKFQPSSSHSGDCSLGLPGYQDFLSIKTLLN